MYCISAADLYLAKSFPSLLERWLDISALRIGVINALAKDAL